VLSKAKNHHFPLTLKSNTFSHGVGASPDRVLETGTPSHSLESVMKTACHTTSRRIVMAEADPTTQQQDWKEHIVPGRFEGRTVIVTGAGSGIGRATALRLLGEGAHVIATDIAEDRLEALTKDANNDALVTIVGDVSKEEDVAAIVNAAGGRIDGLANVAGIMDNMTPVHEVTDEIWNRVMAVNVDGPFRLMRAVIPVMLAAGKGAIVNVVSEASLRGSAAGAAYTTSKHAMVGLTKSASFMYQQKGIRVNGVAPGPVATNIQAPFDSELGKSRIMAAMGAMPQIATSEMLAASITFMLSDDSVNISGAILPSDGGWSAV
jgi:NAD(P)-dependent dehydrogenase (short-subunit alcohol dehydrogenase family)